MKYILTNTLSSSARFQGHPRAGRSTIVPWAYEASPMFNRDFSCHAIELRRYFMYAKQNVRLVSLPRFTR